MPYCPQCGKEALPGYRFCTSCGTGIPIFPAPPIPSGSRMTEMFCVKCRKKVNVEQAKVKVEVRGRKMMRATCSICGTSMTKFTK